MGNSFRKFYEDLFYSVDNGIFEILYYNIYSIMDRMNLLYSISLIKNNFMLFSGDMDFEISIEPYSPFPEIEKYCHTSERINLLKGVYSAYGWKDVFETDNCGIVNQLGLVLALTMEPELEKSNPNMFDRNVYILSKMYSNYSDFTDFAKEQLKKEWGIELDRAVVEELIYDEENCCLDDVLIIKNESVSNLGDIPSDFFSDLSIFGDVLDLYFPAKLVMGTDGFLYMLIKGYYIYDGRYNFSTSLNYFLNPEKLTLFKDFAEIVA